MLRSKADAKSECSRDFKSGSKYMEHMEYMKFDRIVSFPGLDLESEPEPEPLYLNRDLTRELQCGKY